MQPDVFDIIVMNFKQILYGALNKYLIIGMDFEVTSYKIIREEDTKQTKFKVTYKIKGNGISRDVVHFAIPDAVLEDFKRRKNLSINDLDIRYLSHGIFNVRAKHIGGSILEKI